MVNGPESAKFWSEVITSRCGYPAPRRLAAQFAAAEFHDFCPCGCNSFGVRILGSAGAPPLAAASTLPRVIYEANFMLPEGKQIEILLFADASGNLSYVEVDCCVNSYPIPDDLELPEAPYTTSESRELLQDP